MAEGYAINEIGRGGINIATIYRSRRGALVNWLVLEKRIKVDVEWTDDMIEAAWQSMRSERDYCIKVEVTASQAPGANVTERPV